MPTKIEWSDEVWNSIRGCSRKSPGCDNCYAIPQARRFDTPGGAYEGLTRVGKDGRIDWSGKVVLVEEHLLDPIKWRKPKRVFVNSMSDLFHPSLPDLEVASIWATMAACHELGRGHQFQVLTKRPDRMAKLTNDRAWRDTVTVMATETLHPSWLKERPTPRLLDLPWPLPNVWLGTSVEDQARADERVPHLLAARAAVRFLSCEPLIGPIDLTPWAMRGWRCAAECGIVKTWDDGHSDQNWCANCRGEVWPEPGLDWVIVGGESGNNARPVKLDWMLNLVQQCKNLGIAVFVKQLGSVIAKDAGLQDSKGGDMKDWPEALRVRQMPGEARDG